MVAKIPPEIFFMDRISDSVSGIRPFFSYPVSGRIPDIKNRISGFRISGRISGKPDISMIFLLLFEDLRCFNYLSNSVEQRTGIEISGIRQDIRPDIRYPAPTGYPAGYPVSGFQNGRISGRPDIRQNCYPVHPYC